MGLRVHKMVGWGTDELQIKDRKDFDAQMENLWDLSTHEWLAWLTSHQAQIREIAEEHFPSNIPKPGSLLPMTIEILRHEVPRGVIDIDTPNYCVSHDDEFGHENTIVICPTHMMNRCRRYNDLVDWLEESGEVRFRYLEKGIYPFDKGMIAEDVVGLCLFLGIEDVIPKLREALYVYWG